MCLDSGYVYILSNDSLKDNLLKIGATKSIPSERSAHLSKSTSIPGDFKVEYYRETGNYLQAEKRVHLLLKEFRYSENKEFFSVRIPDAVKVVKYVTASMRMQWAVDNEIALHHDFIFAGFSKKMTATAMTLLRMLTLYSPSNTMIDHFVGLPDTNRHGFLSHTQLAEKFQISREQAKKNMKNFVTSYGNLEIMLESSKKARIFKDIRYGDGELGWIFRRDFRRLFYNSLVPELSNLCG